jgi:hypothetical protein
MLDGWGNPVFGTKLMDVIFGKKLIFQICVCT